MEGESEQYFRSLDFRTVWTWVLLIILPVYICSVKNHNSPGLAQTCAGGSPQNVRGHLSLHGFIPGWSKHSDTIQYYNISGARSLQMTALWQSRSPEREFARCWQGSRARRTPRLRGSCYPACANDDWTAELCAQHLSFSLFLSFSLSLFLSLSLSLFFCVIIPTLSRC